MSIILSTRQKQIGDSQISDTKVCLIQIDSIYVWKQVQVKKNGSSQKKTDLTRVDEDRLHQFQGVTGANPFLLYSPLPLLTFVFGYAFAFCSFRYLYHGV